MSVELDVLKNLKIKLGLNLAISLDINILGMIMSQLRVESFNFTKFTELTGYSAANLLRVFPSHVTDLADAQQLIAQGNAAVMNRVYANRMGNGDEASGDGFKYIGRGMLQFTGKSNYELLSQHTGIDLVTFPSKVVALDALGDLSGWWLYRNSSFLDAARAGNVVKCTAIVNGGTNGLKFRIDAYNYYVPLIKTKMSEGFFDA